MDVNENSSYWTNGVIGLRALEPSDWEAYFAWNQDDDMSRSMYVVPFPQSQEAVRNWAEQETLRKPGDDSFRFAIVDSAGALVGDLTTHQCDRRNGTFSYGVCVAKASRRRGYARAAITLVLRYYFQELRYQKAAVSIYSFNEGSIRLHEALGFQREGRLRRMGYSDGAYFDHLVYGITAEEFRDGRYGARH